MPEGWLDQSAEFVEVSIVPPAPKATNRPSIGFARWERLWVCAGVRFSRRAAVLRLTFRPPWPLGQHSAFRPTGGEPSGGLMARLSDLSGESVSSCFIRSETERANRKATNDISACATR